MTRLALTLAALAFLAGAAEASQQGVAAATRWKLMDNCAKQAQVAYPDFTPASNAKRDARLNECLDSNNLPPREPLSQPNTR